MELFNRQKIEELNKILRGLPGAVVAYSGGVDSTLLAYLAQQALGARSMAVTAVSPTYPASQLEVARAIALKYGFNFKVIYTNEFANEEFVANHPERCYYCKRELFAELKRIADKLGYVVCDGANADDYFDYRPGHRAALEMGVHSPLLEVGLSKAEIRSLSKELKLPTWNKPAYACLASRIPYDVKITPDKLSRIERGEAFLASLGLKTFRLRDHDPIARLEVAKEELDQAWALRESIAGALHVLGFKYVTLDMDGFRSGSMNEVLQGLDEKEQQRA